MPPRPGARRRAGQSTAPDLPRPTIAYRPRSWWPLLWAALALVLLARATSRREERGVILDHVEFGRRLVHGEDLYAPWTTDARRPAKVLHPPYPPSFGLLTAPFAGIAELLGMRAARAAWALLQLGCLATIALLLRRQVTPRAPPQPCAPSRNWHLLWLCTALLGARFVLRDTHGGGGNLVNLALCLAAFDLAERRREGLAGLLLGFSLATKPTQLWLLPLFFVLGRRRTVGTTLAAGLGCVVLTLPLLHFDPASWWRWLEGTWRLGSQADAFATPALDFPAFEWMNQSLRFGLARWCGEVPAEFAARVPFGFVPGLGWPPEVVAWLTRLASLLGLTALLVVARRTRGSAAARAFVFAAALVLSVLLSPLSWKAHHVALLPLLFLLLLRLPHRGTLALLLAWALCCQPGQELIGDAGDEWLNSLYVITAWDAVLLVVALRRAGSAALQHEDAARVAGRA